MERDEEPSLLRRSYLALSGVGLAAIAGCQENAELEAPARFEIAGVDAPGTATAGERITLEAEVENVGDRAGETTVELRLDGEVLDATTVELAPDETTTVSFEHQVSEAGEWNPVIDTGHQSETVAVSIEDSEAAEFSVEGMEAPSSVTAGDRFVVRATVSNVGEGAGTAGVTLGVQGETVAETEVPLEVGQTETVRFTPSIDDAGTVEASIDVSGDAVDSREIEIQEREAASFEVTGVEAPSEALAGRSTEFDATVSNTGGVEGTATVALEVDGSTVDERAVTLEPEDNQDVSFSHTFEDTGDREVVLRAGTAEASRTVAVVEPEPSRFDVSELAAPETETETIEFRATARIANTGQEHGVAEVELLIDGEPVDDAAVELDTGEWADVALEWSPTGTGEFEYAVATEDDSESGDVEIVEAQPPDVAAEAARERLAEVAGSIVAKIESDFVDNQGNMVRSDWGAAKATLESVTDKLDEAEGGLDEYDGDAEAVAAEIETLRDARGAVFELGQATGEGASAYTAAAAVLGSLDDGLSLNDLDGPDEAGSPSYVLGQAETGLEKAQSSVADARSAFGNIDDDWLSNFDEDVGAATDLETAADDLETALSNLDSYLTRAWRRLAALPLEPTRDELATAVERSHRQIDDNFLTDPRGGIHPALGGIENNLSTADGHLTTAEELVANIETSTDEAVVEYRNLATVHSALDSLVESMADGATGINDATDAVALVDMSETAYDQASDELDSASSALSEATSHFSSARSALEELDSSWVEDFDAYVGTGDIEIVFERFESAIDAAEILESGIDRLLDVAGPVRTANSLYDDEDYSAAASKFRDAEDIASDARSELSSGAGDVPSELRVMIDVGACRAGHIADALGLLAEAGDLAADGEFDAAEEKGDEALEVANADCP